MSSSVIDPPRPADLEPVPARTVTREPSLAGRKTILVGPVYPYRGGVSYCTVELAKQLPGADVISFSRQFPRALYPGKQDLDPTLSSFHARRLLDILNPWTWLRTALAIEEDLHA